MKQPFPSPLQVMSMIPGFSNAIMQPGSEKESQARLKRFMTIMDSMTAKELDSSSTKIFSEPSRHVLVGIHWCGMLLQFMT